MWRQSGEIWLGENGPDNQCTESFSKRFIRDDDPRDYDDDGELLYAVFDVTAYGTYHEVGGETPGSTAIEFDYEVMFQYTLCRGLDDGAIVGEEWFDIDYYEPNALVLDSTKVSEEKARYYIERFTAEDVGWDGRPTPTGVMQ